MVTQQDISNTFHYWIDFSRRGLPTLKPVPVAAEPLGIWDNAPLEQDWAVAGTAGRQGMCRRLGTECHGSDLVAASLQDPWDTALCCLIVTSGGNDISYFCKNVFKVSDILPPMKACKELFRSPFSPQSCGNNFLACRTKKLEQMT